MRDLECDNGACELRIAFVEIILREPAWLEVWRLLINDDWYRAQLRRCAEQVVRSGGAPQAWVDDVEQDAVLLLARQLQRTVDLSYDLDRSPDQFGGWIRTIMFRQCREAMRGMRRRHGGHQTLQDDQNGATELSMDAQIDLRLAIDGLQDQERAILHLDSSGLSIAQIASRLGLTYWQVQYGRRKGLEHLRTTLGSAYRPDFSIK